MNRTATEEKELRFKAIYEETFEKLNRILLGALKNQSLVHDALQEAYLKLWVKWEEKQHQENHFSFLYFYARTYALKRLARDIKRELLESELFKGKDLVNVESEMDQKECRHQLEQIVSQMPSKRKEIYRLFKEEGLSYQSISEKLCISSKTVDSQLTQANKTIRKQMIALYSITKLILLSFWLH